MAGPLTIRPATADDAETIRQVVFMVLREYGLKADNRGIDADLDDVPASYVKPGGLFEVLEDPDGTVVGTVGLFPLDSRRCELRKMYFVPGIRSHGWGKAVLARIIEKARALGFVEMRLETAGVLHEAISLYQSFGFVEVPAELDASRCDQAFKLNLQRYRRPAGLRMLRERT